MEQWIEFGNKLRRLINPATFPVAVRFLEDKNQIPERARRPLSDLKVTMAPCQGIAMTRKYGWTVAFTHEDVGCAIAAHTYGWERLRDEKGAIDFFIRMNYAANESAASEVLAGFYLLDMGKDPAIVFSPLERTRIEPHVILIYVNPAQLMRLLHGATFLTGKPLDCSFSGRAASCTEGALGAFIDDEPKVVVPGNGDRVWAACQDHEMIMAIPATLLSAVVEGLEKTHEKGIRYPIPSYLRYQPEVANTIPLSDIFQARAAGEPNS